MVAASWRGLWVGCLAGLALVALLGIFAAARGLVREVLSPGPAPVAEDGPLVVWPSIMCVTTASHGTALLAPSWSDAAAITTWIVIEVRREPAGDEADAATWELRWDYGDRMESPRLDSVRSREDGR